MTTLENSLIVPQMVKHRVNTFGIMLYINKIYPRENKTHVHTKTGTGISITVLFIIDKKQKQLICPLSDECINKMWYIHRIEYFLQQKEISTDICYNVDGPWRHYTKWNSQPQRTTYCMSLFIWNGQNWQICREIKYISGCL